MLSRSWMQIILIIGILFIVYSVSYAGKLFSGLGTPQKSGPQLWVDNCSRCHNYRAPTEFTPNQWNTIMLHMRIQGGLTGKEAKEILAYLSDASLSEFKTATTTSSAAFKSSSDKEELPPLGGIPPIPWIMLCSKTPDD